MIILYTSKGSMTQERLRIYDSNNKITFSLVHEQCNLKIEIQFE